MMTNKTPAAMVEEEVRKWLELEDDLLPVVPLVLAVANKLGGPAVWLMIVAPPSSGKSEMILGISAIDGVYALSKLTPQTLASGMRRGSEDKKDPSLLERLKKDGKWLLTLKDWGTITSMQQSNRDAILGQLREVYDGSFDATYGTGVEVNWKGKLGMLVGATQAVDRQSAWSLELGERFLQFRPIPPDMEKVALRAIAQAKDDEKLRRAIRSAFERAFRQANKLLSEKTPYTKIHSAYQKMAAGLALFVANARRPVRRDRFAGSFEVMPPEGPARLAKCLVQLYAAAVVCYEGDREAARRLVCRVATDSMHGRRGQLLKELAKSPEGITVGKMSAVLGCDSRTAQTEFDDLVVLGLAAKDKPLNTVIYKASTKLVTQAEAVFNNQQCVGLDALQKLFDIRTNPTPEGRERRRRRLGQTKRLLEGVYGLFGREKVLSMVARRIRPIGPGGPTLPHHPYYPFLRFARGFTPKK